jgi:NCS1 family nucleobase:cation symporter-1
MGQTVADAGTSTGSLVEVRSIDYVPQAERFGKVWHLGPVWFQGNAQLATLAVGQIGVSLGLNFAWSLVAILLGTLVGTLFMAFHSAQGPKLGLPQMIQSRPQFGYFGSLLPVVAAVLLFVGFNLFNTVIGGEVVQATTRSSFSLTAAELVMPILALIFTAFGYRVIHIGLRWGTYLFLAAFGFFTIAALATTHLPAGQNSLSGTFHLAPFLIEFGVVMSYQLTWAPYVSEYSRYLPHNTTTASTFWYTYIGSGLGALWPMALGAYVLAWNANLGFVDALKQMGDGIFSGFGEILLLSAWIGLIGVLAMNMYSGGLAALAAIDVLKPIKPNVSARFVSITFIAVAASVGALFIPESFLGSFFNFLLIILYFMIPWTAVNLIDFFFVRKERYAILEIFKPNGIYLRWGWRGLAAYFAGFVVMIPFFSTTIYTGPVASALDGGDISPFIGFPVAAILYYLLARKLDVESEWRLADQQAPMLESLAEEHERIGEPTPADIIPETDARETLT